MTTILTVGHSNHPIEHFIALLRQHEVATLVDVRSLPYSRWAPHFQKDRLAGSLAAEGIAYVFLGYELGGRPDGEEFYDADGRLDYRLRTGSADFRAGIDRLLELAREKSTAIVCAEENPARCHRRLLITPELRQRGLEILHVRGDGRTEREPGREGLQAELFR